MARKGQFKKGGGRVGDGSSHRSGGGGGGRGRGRKTSTAIVVVPQQIARRPAKRKAHHVTHHSTAYQPKRRRGKGHHRGVTWGKLAATAVVLGNVAGTNSGPLGATVYDWVQKIPGSKTFGGAATAGGALGLLSLTRLGRGKAGPWLRAAGFVGIVAAALKVGEQGTSFKWLGGDVEDGVMRIQR